MADISGSMWPGRGCATAVAPGGVDLRARYVRWNSESIRNHCQSGAPVHLPGHLTQEHTNLSAGDFMNWNVTDIGHLGESAGERNHNHAQQRGSHAGRVSFGKGWVVDQHSDVWLGSLRRRAGVLLSTTCCSMRLTRCGWMRLTDPCRP